MCVSVFTSSCKTIYHEELGCSGLQMLIVYNLVRTRLIDDIMCNFKRIVERTVKEKKVVMTC